MLLISKALFMTRLPSPRQHPDDQPAELHFTTPGGLNLPPTTLRNHLALVGGPLDVMHQTAQFLRQADQQQVPLILLGGWQDGAFLDLPELLELNAVRTVVVPPILPQTSPDQLREILTETTQSLRTLLGQGPQLLFTGRHLGGHWPFVMGRLAAFSQQGGIVVSDVRHHLSTPLPQSFSHFLVWPEGAQRLGRAVERWQRHQRPSPYRVTREPQGTVELWSAP